MKETLIATLTAINKGTLEGTLATNLTLTGNLDIPTEVRIQGSFVEWDTVLNKPKFATVAITGDYEDLNNKPVRFDTLSNSDVLSIWQSI